MVQWVALIAVVLLLSMLSAFLGNRSVKGRGAVYAASEAGCAGGQFHGSRSPIRLLG